jgi:O-antigen/teichoic acid export membrane protein
MVGRAAAAAANHGPQLRGSVWLSLAVVTNALGGFVFWLVAARLYDGEEFGQASALFTTVLFVNYATSLGLPVAVGRYARDHTAGAHRLFNVALLATSASSVLGSLVVLAALPDSVVDPMWTRGVGLGATVYTLIVIGMSFTVLGEIRLMAMRRWGWVVTRAVAVGIIRVPLLWLHPMEDDALWIFLLVAGVPAISGYIVVLLVSRMDHGWRVRPLPPETRSAMDFAMVNYVGLLALQAPQFALPLIVLVNVSASTMASFYVAFSIASVAFLIPHTLGQVLLVEGGKDDRDPRSQTRLTLVLGLAAMVVATAGAIVLAPLLTKLYGEDFAAAADALPWFVGAAIPWALASPLLTHARLHERRRPILAITGSLALATLIPAVLLVPDHDIAGAAISWTSGNVVAAIVAVWTGGAVLWNRRAAIRGA